LSFKSVRRASQPQLDSLIALAFWYIVSSSLLADLLVCLLGIVDVLQQRGVGDLLLLVVDLLLQVLSLQGQHRHCGLVVVSL